MIMNSHFARRFVARVLRWNTYEVMKDKFFFAIFIQLACVCDRQTDDEQRELQ